MSDIARAAQGFVNQPQVWVAAEQFLQNVSMQDLCQALASAQLSRAQTQSCVDAFERLLSFEEVRSQVITDAMRPYLQQGAQSPDDRIRVLIATALLEVAKSGAASGLLTGPAPTGVDLLLTLVVDPVMDVGEPVSEAMAKLVVVEGAPEVVAGPAALQVLQGGLSLADEVKCRIMDLALELGRASQQAFDSCASAGLYQSVINSFFTDDLLLKLVAVELMEKLGSYERGVQFLAGADVSERLVVELEDPSQDDTVVVCVVRLLGCLALKSEAFVARLLPSASAPLPTTLVKLFRGKHEAGRLAAVNCWSMLCAQREGLEFFVNVMPDFLAEITDAIVGTDNSKAVAVMAGWTLVLSHRPATKANAKIQELIVQKLLPHALKALLQKPFADARPHNWQLLAEMAHMKQTAQQTLTVESVRDVLTNYRSEDSANALIGKHQFVSALLEAHSNVASTVFEDETYENLCGYVKGGPYWTPQGAQAVVDREAG